MADNNQQFGGNNPQLSQIAQNGTLLIQVLSKIAVNLASLFSLSGYVGSFTCAAAATTVVANTSTKASSIILLMPTNAAAGTLQGSAKSLYVSARTAGTSFTVATASAASAAGTETFSYVLINVAGGS